MIRRKITSCTEGLLWNNKHGIWPKWPCLQLPLVGKREKCACAGLKQTLRGTFYGLAMTSNVSFHNTASLAELIGSLKFGDF